MSGMPAGVRLVRIGAPDVESVAEWFFRGVKGGKVLEDSLTKAGISVSSEPGKCQGGRRKLASPGVVSASKRFSGVRPFKLTGADDTSDSVSRSIETD